MVQFEILSGKQAGARWVARHFPVRVGRAPNNDLRLEEEGVWDQHCVLNFDPTEGFTLVAQPDALLTVNHEPERSIRVRNGDTLGIGSVRLQFWLKHVPQRGQALREWFVWVIVVAICTAEVALIYWLH